MSSGINLTRFVVCETGQNDEHVTVSFRYLKTNLYNNDQLSINYFWVHKEQWKNILWGFGG